jgi:hypothetical protein
MVSHLEVVSGNIKINVGSKSMRRQFLEGQAVEFFYHM